MSYEEPPQPISSPTIFSYQRVRRCPCPVACIDSAAISVLAGSLIPRGTTRGFTGFASNADFIHHSLEKSEKHKRHFHPAKRYLFEIGLDVVYLSTTSAVVFQAVLPTL